MVGKIEEITPFSFQPVYSILIDIPSGARLTFYNPQGAIMFILLIVTHSSSNTPINKIKRSPSF